MANLAGGIAQRGFDVDLVLLRAEGPYLNTLPPEVRVIDLGVTRAAHGVFPLYRYLRRERPTVLLSALLYVNIVALVAGLAARCTRLVISERNTVSVDQTNISSFSIRFARVLAKYLYRRADAIIAVSHGVARDLAAFTGIPVERIDVVNNPVVTPQLLEQAARAAEPPLAAGER